MITARIVEVDSNTINSMLYQPNSTEFVQYLQTNLPTLDSNIAGLSASYINNVQTLFNNAYSDQALIRGKLFLNNTGEITYLPVNRLYQPYNYVMQQYIMAQPELNYKYSKGLVHGYKETYVDLEVDTYGKDNMAYRRTTDGVLQFEEQDNDYTGYILSYSQDDEELYGEDLTVQQQIKILDTWDNITLALYNKLDPTDPEEVLD